MARFRTVLSLFLVYITGTLALVISGNATTEAVPLQWGSIGDSWNSGVAYSLDTLYDKNKNGCLRIKGSYSDQMNQDKNWVVPSLSPTKFEWPGCSGSLLVDMYAGKRQILDTGTPQFVVMTAGGNNADFGTIARKCLFNDNPTPYFYGPPYHLVSLRHCGLADLRRLSSSQPVHTIELYHSQLLARFS
jgi:hypothetical protein